MNIKELQTTEYGSFYSAYIEALGAVELLSELRERQKVFSELISELQPADLEYRYAPGKWSIAELIVHITDAERVFQYRALRFGRGDETPLPGYDQDIFVPHSNAGNRSLTSLLEEFNTVRNASVILFENFTDEDLLRMGSASGYDVSVRALGFMICGHQKHHENILISRYLNR